MIGATVDDDPKTDVTEIPDSDVHQSRAIPETHVGKISPNYYCRGWNQKRGKYCSARAGRSTDHVGVGRCKFHDGRAITHGATSTKTRYGLLTDALGDFYEALEGEDVETSLNVLPEIAAARALLLEYIEDYAQHEERFRTWSTAWGIHHEEAPPRVPFLSLTELYKMLDSISKMVDREKKDRRAGAVGIKDLTRIMAEMGRVVNHHIDTLDSTPTQTKERIRADWMKIRL